MTSTRGYDGTMLMACLLFVVLMVRSVSMCTFVFLSVNLNIFRVAACQVQVKGVAAPFSARSRNDRPGLVRRESANGGSKSPSNRKL